MPSMCLGRRVSWQIAKLERYPLQRWRTVVNIMLEKEPGSPRIHRLWVIHIIYEADYNLNVGGEMVARGYVQGTRKT